MFFAPYKIANFWFFPLTFKTPISRPCISCILTFVSLSNSVKLLYNYLMIYV